MTGISQWPRWRGPRRRRLHQRECLGSGSPELAWWSPEFTIRKPERYGRRICRDGTTSRCANGSSPNFPGRSSPTATARLMCSPSNGSARRVLEETAKYLGMGIANIVSILNPQIVVLGGGLMQAGDLLLDPLRREVREWAQPLAARSVRIELTQLGEEAGVLGSARLALEENCVR